MIFYLYKSYSCRPSYYNNLIKVQQDNTQASCAINLTRNFHFRIWLEIFSSLKNKLIYLKNKKFLYLNKQMHQPHWNKPKISLTSVDDQIKKHIHLSSIFSLFFSKNKPMLIGRQQQQQTQFLFSN